MLELQTEKRSNQSEASDILLVSLNFYPEPTGSAPPISDLAAWLAENGKPLLVAAARPNYPNREVFEGYRNGELDHELWGNVEIQRLKSFVSKSDGMLGRLLTEGSYALSLIWARLRGRISPVPRVISVCPSVFTVLAASLYVRRGGRHLVIVHDIQSGLGARVAGGGAAMSLVRRIERYAFNRADNIITLSTSMKRALEDLGVQREIHIAPPHVDCRKITPLPEPKGESIILYSGAFGRKQGLHQVLDAAGILLRRSLSARFVLRGQGGLESELKQRTAKEDLTNVTIQPLAAANSLNAAMSEGIIHLVPQLPDGSDFAVPSKVFSIMSAGRPFIATAEPNTPLYDLAQDSRAGVCVPPEQPEKLADAIEALLNDPDRRIALGRAGRLYVARHVDREVVCAEILRVLDGN